MARETLSEKEAFAQSLLTPIESYIMWFQDFLVWKKPLLSAGVLLFVHAFFWLSSCLTLYQLLALVGACAICLDFVLCQFMLKMAASKTKSSQPSQNESLTPGILSVPEVSHLVAQWWLWIETQLNTLGRLKQHNKAKFSALGLVFFTCTLLVGHCIPGIYIVYICWMCLLLGPGAVYHKVPQKVLIYLDPFLLDIERRLGIKRQRNKQVVVEVRATDAEADILREFDSCSAAVPQLQTQSSVEPNFDEDNDSMCLSSQVMGNASDSDEDVGSFARGLSVPSLGDPLLDSDLSLAPSLSHFADDASLRGSLVSFDEDRLVSGLAFSDLPDGITPENEVLPALPVLAAIDPVQSNITASDSTVGSTSNIAEQSAVSSLGAGSTGDSHLAKSLASNDDTINDFEFLNQEDLADIDESESVK